MNVGKDTEVFAAFLSLGIFLCLLPDCLGNEHQSRGAVIYAWAICLLLLEKCFKTAEAASPLPPVHGHMNACSIPDIPFPPINFTSFWIMHLSSPIHVSNSSHAKGILLGLGKRRVCQSPPSRWQHQAFETGSHELCHLLRVKLSYHLGPFQRLHSPMD